MREELRTFIVLLLLGPLTARSLSARHTEQAEGLTPTQTGEVEDPKSTEADEQQRAGKTSDEVGRTIGGGILGAVLGGTVGGLIGGLYGGVLCSPLPPVAPACAAAGAAAGGGMGATSGSVIGAIKQFGFKRSE